MDTKPRRVVLRRAHDVPIAADLYTLIAYLRGITVLRRSVQAD